MKLVVFAVFSICLSTAGFYFFRKNLPFDFRIINLDNNIIIHNKTTWNTRDLLIKYKINEREGTVKLDGKTNTAIIPDAKEGDNLYLTIHRLDFKGKLFYKPFEYKGIMSKSSKKYAVFIGASIGRDWHLEKLWQRYKLAGNTEIIFWPEYKFDKKSIIDHVLRIPIRPEMVLIKECAAYFPLDEEKAVIKLFEWFTAVKQVGITPVAVTTIPVTRNNDNNNKGRAVSIYRFNNMIREKAENICDIATILGDKDSDYKFLLNKYAKKDGLHVNDEAYLEMDRFLINFLQENR